MECSIFMVYRVRGRGTVRGAILRAISHAPRWSRRWPRATQPASEHPAVAAVRASGSGKVKVACSDIDGILRGKLLHIDKFLGAAQPHPSGGFGFCDVVFGWDSSDVCYDNTQVTGWQHGFPDALARLDLDTARRVPWDGDVPFFLGEFVNADGTPFRGVPAPDLEARAEARRETRRAADGRHGIRVVQLPGNARQLGRQEGRRPADADAGHVRLLAAAHESRTASSSTR